MGKGGGSPAPQTSTVNQSNLPEYARPYFEDLLQRGQTASQVKYTPYTGDRTAGFNPLQTQGFQGAKDLGPSSLNAPAAGITSAAGLGGIGAGLDYAKQATSPGAIAAYMSPYQQKVVDFQKTQAIDDYGRQLPGQQAAASRAGAFGGSRQAIVEAENRRNLQNTLAGIQAQGSQQAFEQANKNLQFGSQLGLQGLGLAGQMGQQFGQLGQTAFGQQAAAAQAQQAAGATQQAQSQDILNKRYEDFMQQQTFPQSQLQFYSSLLRGVPVSPNQTMYQYQAPASGISQLAGLGMGAYGMSQAFKADGGVVSGYAVGGITGGPEGQPTTLEVSKIKTALLKGADPRSFPPSIALLLAVSDPQVKNAIDTREGAEVQAALDQGREIAQLPSIMEEQMDQLEPSGGIAGLNMGAMEDAEYGGGGIIAFKNGLTVPPGVRYEPEEPAATPFGRFFQNIGMGQKQNIEEEYLRRELMKKYGPQAGLGGLFTAQSDESRKRAQEILDRSKNMSLAELRDFSQNPEAGLPTALPQSAAKPTVPALPQSAAKPTVPAIKKTGLDIERDKVKASLLSTATPPGTPQAPPSLLYTGKSPEQAFTDREAEMERRFPSEMKDRLEELKMQGQQAVKDRDADRWMAVAMGGFSMAANAKPGARGLGGFLGDLGSGLQLTTKELVGVNKEFRKGQALRTAAEREERKADRLESMQKYDSADKARTRVEDIKRQADQAQAGLQVALEGLAIKKTAVKVNQQKVDIMSRAYTDKADQLKVDYVNAVRSKDPVAIRNAKQALRDYTEATNPQRFEKPDDPFMKMITSPTAQSKLSPEQQAILNKYR